MSVVVVSSLTELMTLSVSWVSLLVGWSPLPLPDPWAVDNNYADNKYIIIRLPEAVDSSST